MKKRIVGMAVLLCMVAAVGMAQEENDGRFHVYVEEPGFLMPAIREAWFNIPYSERLGWAKDMKMVIHGNMEGSDFRELRCVMGDSDGLGFYTVTAHFFEVTELDRSDVHIVGHGWYGWSATVLPETPHGCTLQRPKEKVVGCAMFDSRHDLKRLVLPEETETVRVDIMSDAPDYYSVELVLPANVKFFDIIQDFYFSRIVCKGTEPPVCTLTQEYWWDDWRVVTDTVRTEEDVKQFEKDGKLLLGGLTVVVPKGCREKYMQTSLWRYAKEIVEEGEFTDVKAVEADGTAQKPSGERRTFRLDGRLAQPGERGIVVHEGRKELKR